MKIFSVKTSAPSLFSVVNPDPDLLAIRHQLDDDLASVVAS